MLIDKTIHKVIGGQFIIKDSTPDDIFIWSEFTEEQLLMVDSAKEFIKHHVEPVVDVLENHKDDTLTIKLLEKAGELGFLGLGVPEEYGGYEVPFNVTLLMAQEFSKRPEFALTIGVQTSIGITPILLYGNKAQKNKYLPKFVTGEWKCCYCLTEPNAGSDANSGKTRAIYLPTENFYLINGQKMWITNAGIADIFIVFSKIEEDENLSAFIVERNFDGISLGNEENKMGIRGSSTRQVFFNNVKVPAENMLGERGQGFKIALNVLNTGRIKLGAGALGLGQRALDTSIKYAKERKQFGACISSFGAIKHKIAQMATKLFVLEASVYRTGNNIDKKYNELVLEGMPKEQAKSACVTEFGIECAINKVFGSEVQDFIIDEGVQIFGGMGFSEDGPMSRMYRDSRISRIFEGTNEINRMLIVDMLLKKGMNGTLDLMSAVMAVQQELLSIPDLTHNSENNLFTETTTVLKQLKKATLLVAGAAAQKLLIKIKEEQEVLMNVADMLINVYLLESTLLRIQKQASISGENTVENAILQVCMYDTMKNIRDAGEEALYSFAEGEDLKIMLMALGRFVKITPINTKKLRREIADHFIDVTN